MEPRAIIDWTIALPTFLTAAVEWVAAFTIVLAVSLSIGWRAASGAALAALAVLAAMTAITGACSGSASTSAGCGWRSASSCCCSACAGSPRRSRAAPA
jgi:hypothetical protein